MPMRVRLRDYSLQLIVYSSFTAAGVACLLNPPITVTAAIAPQVAVAWSVLMTLGGVACLTGILSGRLAIKLFGLPLLISATMVYVLLIWVRVLTRHTPNPIGSLVSAFLLMGFAGLLLLRWVEVRRLIRHDGGQE